MCQAAQEAELSSAGSLFSRIFRTALRNTSVFFRGNKASLGFTFHYLHFLHLLLKPSLSTDEAITAIHLSGPVDLNDSF